MKEKTIYKAKYIEQKQTKNTKKGSKEYISRRYDCVIPLDMAEKIGLNPNDLDIKFTYNEDYNLIVIQKL